MQKKVLGRGLSALMPERPIERGAKVVDLKISEISLSKFQPRQEISPEKLAELMASIKEKGVIQPLLVRPQKEGYELIAGERRLRAAKELGLSQLPAIIRDVEDAEALQLSLIENIQREELNPLEEAQAFQRLVKGFGYTQEKIAQVVGKDASSVSNILRLLKLPSEIQAALSKGKITMGHARTILGLSSVEEQSKVFQRTLAEGLSVRELENLTSKKLPRLKRRRSQSLHDPHLVALEEQIQHILGTRVKIISGRKRGKIVLEYYSLNDLERVIKLLKSIK